MINPRDVYDEDYALVVWCRNDGCYFDDEVEGVKNGYSFYWVCPDCDYEQEEAIDDEDV